MRCGDVAKVLFLNDDTIRTWYRLYQEDGFDGLVSFGYDGSVCRLSEMLQDQLKAWITETLGYSWRDAACMCACDHAHMRTVREAHMCTRECDTPIRTSTSSQ
jgi:hypothetical protein